MNRRRVVLIEWPVEKLFDCPGIVWWSVGWVFCFHGGTVECWWGEGVVHFWKKLSFFGKFCLFCSLLAPRCCDDASKIKVGVNWCTASILWWWLSLYDIAIAVATKRRQQRTPWSFAKKWRWPFFRALLTRLEMAGSTACTEAVGVFSSYPYLLSLSSRFRLPFLHRTIVDASRLV